VISIVPITFQEANAFVAKHHRHHKPVTGMKFCLAISDGENIRGVALIGRPVARHLDNGWTLEVNRCCTDGVKNGCSMLYGAAWRITKQMGYLRLITYTLPSEGGTSLVASGWKLIGEAGGSPWNSKKRPRVDIMPNQTKLLWEVKQPTNQQQEG